MNRAIATLAKIINTMVVHMIFAVLLILVYLSIVQAGLSFSSAIDTATAMILVVICIMVVRGIFATMFQFSRGGNNDRSKRFAV